MFSALSLFSSWDHNNVNVSLRHDAQEIPLSILILYTFFFLFTVQLPSFPSIGLLHCQSVLWNPLICFRFSPLYFLYLFVFFSSVFLFLYIFVYVFFIGIQYASILHITKCSSGQVPRSVPVI